MRTLPELFANNRAWAVETERQRPGFFGQLARQQRPRYLWIGCSDSRVPANQIVGLLPGELFVHRNVANLVVPTDFNCLSVLQFAVEVLKVEHVIVCGHYGCGGIAAADAGAKLGLIDNWLQHIKSVRERHADELAALEAPAARQDRLCELNVVEQVRHVCQSTVVEGAWDRGQPLAVHGWIYRIDDGLLRELGLCVTGRAELGPITARALRAAPRRA